MIRRDVSRLYHGRGRRPLTVIRIRRDCPLTRRIARRMRAAGRPSSWIAAALGVSATTAAKLIAIDTIWTETAA